MTIQPKQPTSTNASTDMSQEARRQYWTEQMDLAADFMLLAVQAPVEECGEPLACLKTSVSEAGVEVQFSDTRYANGMERQYYMRQGLVPGVIKAAETMNRRGWVMKIEDALRTLDMQANVGRQPLVFDAILKTTCWECGGKTPSIDLLLKRFGAMTALNAKVGTHTSASALDISMYDRKSGQEIDRGGPYLEMSELTPMDSPFVSDQAKANRREMTQIMAENGLLAYPFEFWHFNGGDCYESLLLDNGPGRYGPVNTHLPDLAVTPVTDPTRPLNTTQDMERMIHAALKRLSRI